MDQNKKRNEMELDKKNMVTLEQKKFMPETTTATAESQSEADGFLLLFFFAL